MLIMGFFYINWYRVCCIFTEISKKNFVNPQ